MGNANSLNTTLILGFFDGIHLGHRTVLDSAVKFAKENNSETVLLTFPKSPAEYFNKIFEYIYPRNINYNFIKNLGVDNISETNFEDLVDITAEDYLEKITKEFMPIAIFSGYNYSFGANRKGSPETLELFKEKYGYKYFCVPPVKSSDNIVSSTMIKNLLKEGKTDAANELLYNSFSLESKVIKGQQIGRTIGFPTANMQYPDNIVKLPYGVYKVRAIEMPAIMNWGIKPTVDGNEPLLEVHIPNFSGDLYGKNLKIQISSKIRDIKKFNSLEELKQQIKKDTEACLK